MMWPKRTVRGQKLPSQIRALTVDQLQDLSRCAEEASGVSATGRVEWVEANRDAIEAVRLQVWDLESPGFYRCIVTLDVDHSGGRYFTLDVAESKLKSYRAISRRRLIELALDYDRHFEHVPVASN